MNFWQTVEVSCRDTRPTENLQHTPSRKFRRNILHRQAFSLLEMSGILSLLSVVILMMASILYGALRIQSLSDRDAARTRVQAALADQFRDDVGQALSLPKTLGEESAGSTCLILRLSESRQIVYRWKDGQLSRTAVNGKDRQSRHVPVGPEVQTVEFRVDTPDRLVTLRLQERNDSKGSPRILEFSAALEGEK